MTLLPLLVVLVSAGMAVGAPAKGDLLTGQEFLAMYMRRQPQYLDHNVIPHKEEFYHEFKDIGSAGPEPTNQPPAETTTGADLEETTTEVPTTLVESTRAERSTTEADWADLEHPSQVVSVRVSSSVVRKKPEPSFERGQEDKTVSVSYRVEAKVADSYSAASQTSQFLREPQNRENRSEEYARAEALTYHRIDLGSDPANTPVSYETSVSSASSDSSVRFYREPPGYDYRGEDIKERQQRNFRDQDGVFGQRERIYTKPETQQPYVKQELYSKQEDYTKPDSYRTPLDEFQKPKQDYSDPQELYRKSEQNYPKPEVYIKPNQDYENPEQIYGKPEQNYGKPEQVYSKPEQIYGKAEQDYGKPEEVYAKSEQIYGKPEQVYAKSEEVYAKPEQGYAKPEEIYGKPEEIFSKSEEVYGKREQVFGKPSQLYVKPEQVYDKPQHVYTKSEEAFGKVEQPYQKQDQAYIKPNDYPKQQPDFIKPERNYGKPEHVYGEPERIYGEPEQNYEIEESVSVTTQGRTHGAQDDPKDKHKFGYVVEGRNFRKYRVEERTSDGFIVGEYGVVSHDDGSLRGVRYTADSNINPRLIYDALVKFLSLK